MGNILFGDNEKSVKATTRTKSSAENKFIDNVIDVVLNTNNNIWNKIIKLKENYIINKDNYAELKRLLKDFDITTCDQNGKNLLHIFAKYNDVKILKILLEHGCSINAKDDSGKTPIFYCDSSFYNFFIENGADINVLDNLGYSELYYKAKYYYASHIKPLLEAGANTDIYNYYDKREQLHIAVLFQDVQKIKELLGEDATLINSVIDNPCVVTKMTPIGVAIKNGFYNEFLLLIEYGEKINPEHLNFFCSKDGVNENHLKILKKLLEIGINVNDLCGKNKNGNDMSVLHNAMFEVTMYYKSETAKKYKSELITILLEAGADIHAKNEKFKEFDEDGERRYLRYEAMCRFDAEPLLFYADMVTDVEVYKTLIKYGADVNLQNCFGLNALIGICNATLFSYCYRPENLYDIVKLFLEAGADILLKDKYGNTALDILCHNDTVRPEIKKKIIELFQEHAKIVYLKPVTHERIYKILNNIHT